MPLGEQRTNLILIAGALILALLVGIVIPLASGSQPGQKPAPWTPPISTSLPTPRPTTPIVQRPTATAAPTRTPATALPTQTALPTVPAPSVSALASPTGTPAPSATAIQSTATRPAPAPSPTPSATGVPSAPVATVSQGPLILRTGPGKDFAVVALGNVGDAFAVVGRTADGAWLKVCCVKDAPVWLAAEFVEVNGDVTGLPISP